jgi:hypothetical protein
VTEIENVKNLLREIVANCQGDPKCLWGLESVDMILKSNKYFDVWNYITDIKDWAEKESGTDKDAPEWWRKAEYSRKIFELPIP